VKWDESATASEVPSDRAAASAVTIVVFFMMSSV
jgi:hypothetical protein